MGENQGICTQAIHPLHEGGNVKTCLNSHPCAILVVVYCQLLRFTFASQLLNCTISIGCGPQVTVANESLLRDPLVTGILGGGGAPKRSIHRGIPSSSRQWSCSVPQALRPELHQWHTLEKHHQHQQQQQQQKKKYFTSSEPHHDMLGGGCQVRVVIYFYSMDREQNYRWNHQRPNASQQMLSADGKNVWYWSAQVTRAPCLCRAFKMWEPSFSGISKQASPPSFFLDFCMILSCSACYSVKHLLEVFKIV